MTVPELADLLHGTDPGAQSWGLVLRGLGQLDPMIAGSDQDDPLPAPELLHSVAWLAVSLWGWEAPAPLCIWRQGSFALAWNEPGRTVVATCEEPRKARVEIIEGAAGRVEDLTW